ncbi:MAG TPA: formate dehydrogenase accessory sulfurtransferase FdhD [Phycisphaerae bacterium]|jgi:FdhD protein
MPAAWRPYDSLQFRGAGGEARLDPVAVEEPLEIRIGKTPLTLLMRTPGDDDELAAGFLLTEGIIASAADLMDLSYCPGVPPEAEGNVIVALLKDSARFDPERLRRNFYASSSCGVCGRASMEHLRQSHPPIQDEVRVPREVLLGLPPQLQREQRGFAATGGLHAAGLFASRGRMLCVREDIGRHNAVDKVIGWAVLEGKTPLAGTILQVSGRASFEIVQKALAARIPIVASVSAPSSLAVDLARQSQMTLASFVRGDQLTLFSGEFRMAEGGAP